nr:extensin [Aegilops tauschii subsp. strangulata]
MAKEMGPIHFAKPGAAPPPETQRKPTPLPASSRTTSPRRLCPLLPRAFARRPLLPRAAARRPPAHTRRRPPPPCSHAPPPAASLLPRAATRRLPAPTRSRRPSPAPTYPRATAAGRLPLPTHALPPPSQPPPSAPPPPSPRQPPLPPPSSASWPVLLTAPLAAPSPTCSSAAVLSSSASAMYHSPIPPSQAVYFCHPHTTSLRRLRPGTCGPTPCSILSYTAPDGPWRRQRRQCVFFLANPQPLLVQRPYSEKERRCYGQQLPRAIPVRSQVRRRYQFALQKLYRCTSCSVYCCSFVHITEEKTKQNKNMIYALLLGPVERTKLF